MMFDQLSAHSQVLRLRRTALRALQQYPLQVERLRLVHHGYNTTFRVDTVDGQRYSLRINVNTHRTPANLAAEMAWLRALADEAVVPVPVPQETSDGGLVGRVPSPDGDRELSVALFSWLPGADLEDRATPAAMRAVGAAMAALHDHGSAWSLPAGATLPRADNPLFDAEPVWRGHPLVDHHQASVFEAALAQCAAAHDVLFASNRAHPLHADLHNGNVKWYRHRITVFDFDDSLIGLPVQDLAIAAYYLRDDSALEEALLDGYAAVRTLPSIVADQYEALVASRNLLLLTELLTSSNAHFQAMLAQYLPNTTVKLRSYLDSGRYRHDVPGVQPLSD